MFIASNDSNPFQKIPHCSAAFFIKHGSATAQGGAPKIAFSWFIPPITRTYNRYIYSIHVIINQRSHHLGGTTLQAGHYIPATARSTPNAQPPGRRWTSAPCSRGNGPSRRPHGAWHSTGPSKGPSAEDI